MLIIFYKDGYISGQDVDSFHVNVEKDVLVKYENGRMFDTKLESIKKVMYNDTLIYTSED